MKESNSGELTGYKFNQTYISGSNISDISKSYNPNKFQLQFRTTILGISTGVCSEVTAASGSITLCSH